MKRDGLTTGEGIAIAGVSAAAGTVLWKVLATGSILDGVKGWFKRKPETPAPAPSPSPSPAPQPAPAPSPEPEPAPPAPPMGDILTRGALIAKALNGEELSPVEQRALVLHIGGGGQAPGAFVNNRLDPNARAGVQTWGAYLGKQQRSGWLLNSLVVVDGRVVPHGWSTRSIEEIRAEFRRIDTPVHADAFGLGFFSTPAATPSAEPPASPPLATSPGGPQADKPWWKEGWSKIPNLPVAVPNSEDASVGLGRATVRAVPHVIQGTSEAAVETFGFGLGTLGGGFLAAAGRPKDEYGALKDDIARTENVLVGKTRLSEATGGKTPRWADYLFKWGG